MIRFIDSKLRPPDLRPGLIERAHLVARLRENLGLSATFICAGPGWGKTTAAAEMIRTVNRPTVWFDIESSDRDMSVFFQYLVRGLRQVSEGFGRSTLEMVTSGSGTRAEQLADLFLYELSEQIDDEIIIVLDNIHHIFASDWSTPLIDRVLQLLPQNIHVMMLARTAPAFTFSRMRSKQSMDQIDDRALAFTRAEAVELLEGALDDPAAIDALLAWTQGWVAGLQIIRHALEAEAALRDRDINSIITESQTEIFDYFAEKVYRAEPTEVRDLLARSSLPSYVTPDILREALGLAVPAEQLHQIVRENIFLNRVAGEPDIFIYHPLFRDFLCKQLEEETTPAERASMHRSLAVYYAERENWEPAIHHFFEAGDEQGAAETLIAARRQLLANGQTATVSNYFPLFSEATLERNFRLYNLMGEMRVIEGDTANANLMFQTALRASRLAGERKTEASALAGLAHTAAREHNFIDAIRFAEEAEACVPAIYAAPQAVTVQTAPLESVGLAARIKNVIGAVRSFEGRYTEANDLMEEALKLAHEAGDARLVRTISQNLALPAYMEGDFPAALRYFSRSPISDHSGGQMHPDSITLFLNRAAIYTARGEMALAEQDLESAIELTNVFNLRGFLPRILEARANIARERLQFDEASELYNSALNEYRRVDADPVKTDLYYERALLEMRRGEHDQAVELINLMIADRKEWRREIEEALGRQMLGRILLDRDAKQRARALAEAEAGEPLLRRLQCNYYLAISCYVRARALADRDAEEGARALKEFLSLAERFDYSYFISNEESFHPALNELCLLYGLRRDGRKVTSDE